MAKSTAIVERADQADQPANGEASKIPTANVPALAPPRLPYHPLVEERFGIDRASWKALVEAIFPNASSVESVILALSYCRARKLDPFKRNVHIVPIWDKNRKCMVDTIWPGIGELRTTAFRTGEYAGRDNTVFGSDITATVGKSELTYPEWAQVTVYRMVKGQRVAFAGPRVYWIETYATRARDDDSPNEMWFTRPRGQHDKCAEAAALRAAFPEEIGSDYIEDEVQHTRVISTIDATETAPGAAGLAKRLSAAAEPEAPAEANGDGEAGNGEPDPESTPTVGQIIHGIVEVATRVSDAEVRSRAIAKWCGAADIDAEELARARDGSKEANAIIDAATKCKLWSTYVKG